MGGEKVSDPDQMLVVLDHNAPPADAKLATQYQEIRDIVDEQGIKKFYDAGKGICHQIMSYHAQSGNADCWQRQPYINSRCIQCHWQQVLTAPNQQVSGKEEKHGSGYLNQLK